MRLGSAGFWQRKLVMCPDRQVAPEKDIKISGWALAGDISG
jgi:hypothetical protein